MLAGRKLLLADDSATIQKVIDLTFADEGVQVMSVSNGQEAVDRILDFAPDIVLADVFMPSPNGYEVCEYVKTNEKLKHIPVMLLVGSFEPFDEAEARRVGADDILTKPFSSIRRLIDRVGALVSSPPVEKDDFVRERPTAELPKPEEPADEPLLSAQELEVTTADTRPLSEGMALDTPSTAVVSGLSSASETPAGVTPSARLEALLREPQSSKHEGTSSIDATSKHEGRMEPGITETKSDAQLESADVLLDLDDIEPPHAHVSSDEFVLDLEDASGDEVAEVTPMRTFVEPEVRFVEPAATFEREATFAPEVPAGSVAAYESSYQPNVQSAFADTQELAYKSRESDSASVKEIEHYEPASVPPEFTPDPVPVFGETEFPIAASSQPATSVNANQLSPEMIDAIARRAVELMSDKVIREIAWEVVPDLAELLIKRQLEEKQAK